jgi:hypothetical protein
MQPVEAAASSASQESREVRGLVVVHAADEHDHASRHERETHAGIAARLAALKGYAFAGTHDPRQRYPGPVYFVPSATLVGLKAAEALGIRGEHDLFGGVVPHPFVATKAITHPLVEPDAAAPEGWSPELGHRVEEAVLRGYSVFTPSDARLAGRRLLARGPVRLKPVRATGGRGQTVVADADALEAALEPLDAAELARWGLVLEEDLTEVATHSVGQVRVAELVVSYHGTQRLTPDNAGVLVYGGSDLLVARGGFDPLLGLELSPAARLAVAQARAYDAAATACFPEMLVSRRNYDVAQGVDAEGRRRSGVLEQSWRIGGASGAEIAALEAFRAEPALRAVRASTVEVYGKGAAPPPHATVCFRGTDDRVGPITKYTLVEAHDDAR